jgi:pilus assembly protein Flp/PilA
VVETIQEEKTMKSLLVRLWKQDEGQDLVEYALLLALLVLVAVATLGTLANAVKNVFTNAASNLTKAT